MRTSAVGLVPVVLLAAGCGPSAVPDVVFDPAATAAAGASYPARTDYLVTQTPAAVPPGWNTPGYPPLKSLAVGPANTPDPAQAATLRPEVGKNVVDPTKDLPAEDRAAVARAVAALYGTPLAPAVPAGRGDADPVAKLHLDPATLARGAGVYRRWCASCHGPAGAGDGPAAATLIPAPRDYRTGLFKFVTSDPTAAPGKPRRADLVRLVRKGIDGTAMPAFPDLPAADLDAVVSYVVHLSLRGETEFTALKRLIVAAEDADTPEAEVKAAAAKAVQGWLTADARPMTPKADGVPADPYTSAEERLAAAARGYKLFVEKTGAGCAACHVDYGKTPQLKYDAWANVAQPRNLLLGQYRGGRTPEDIYARLYVGIAASGMPSHRQLTESPGEGGSDRLWDLVHFVRAAADPALRAELRAKYGVRVE